MIAVLLLNWKPVLVAVVAFALGCAITAPIQKAAGRSEGRAAYQTEIALAAADAERKRVAADAYLSNLSDRALCERSLRARGLPVDACAGL